MLSIHNLPKGFGKASLQSMQTMSRLLNHPEKTFPIIHVAGTNGKGSVSLKIAKAFEFAGFRTGLFTSPHISSFRERIRIGEDLIEEEVLLRHLAIIQKNSDLTFFEVCALLAFQHFSTKKVDMAVIEVGLGGRLDATNIVIPELSVITSIGLDHTEILGSTRELIAVEKGGIVKPGVPVVIGPRVPVEPIRKIAMEMGSELTVLDEQNLPYHLENASIAKEALRRFALPSDAVERALAINPPCRFEKVPGVQVLLDVAHNPDGFEKLLQRLRLEYPGHNYHFMLHLSESKDIAGCAAVVLSAAKSICIPRINHPRLSAPENLLPYFDAPVRIDSAEHLIESYFERAEKNDLLIVCGSFFIMGPIRKILGYREPFDDS